MGGDRGQSQGHRRDNPLAAHALINQLYILGLFHCILMPDLSWQIDEINTVFTDDLGNLLQVEDRTFRALMVSSWPEYVTKSM